MEALFLKNITGNSIVIKEVNINLVRKFLKENMRATKQQIAEATGLSTVTVGTILQNLINQNEAFEIEPSSSNGGRRAHQFQYNADYALGLILFPYETQGSIVVHSAIINLIGECINENDIKVNNIDLSSFERIINDKFASYPDIQAIGFGIAGAEYDGKIVVSDYKSLLGTSMVEHFSCKYQKPVIVENDVNAAVVGFSKRISIDDEDTVVYLYFPEHYPPGAGIFINGKLYKGKRNFAGEIAKIPIGIQWDESNLYNTLDSICKAITNLIISISCVINPDFVVLNGSFITSDHIADVSKRCMKELPESAVPEILQSEDFTQDYLGGLIVKTLKALEPDIMLTRN
jgi:predicted NBD/HSP70 family sugar kinase